ncbi:class II fructose-bisphosphate aldolase [Anaerofustis stercorihominis]|uniref:class II fructose-bisphosphate aldolase n=1 Tax=Anaerofustis stercorihominis TaxID=214853 RepID=UPI0011073B55|nr:class II fructose-bisphosphate aldolase [Anaerofustis stercorihominis]
MALISSTQLFKKAKEEKYAIPAFNFENMEMAKGIIEACSEENSPVIMQTTTSTLKYIAPEIAYEIVNYYAKEYNIDVVLHLDHGASYELCKRCIDSGYTSVMIDGSKLDFEENIALSKKVIDYASKCNVPVECELGRVGGKEDEIIVNDKDALLTDPDKALEFSDRTNCSSLAIAIGTAHGFYKKAPNLDFERLDKINKMVSVPLVLHGTSGTKDEDVKKAISLGMCKVNYATDLRAAFTKGVRDCLKMENVYDPKEYNKAGIETLKLRVKELIEVCGSKNKA